MINKLYLYILLSLLPVLANTPAFAIECLDYIPSHAKPNGDLRLCQSSLNGRMEEYACQEYETNTDTYIVLHKGGPYPLAIALRPQKASFADNEMLWLYRAGSKPLSCEPEIPGVIPQEAAHLGTGICMNELNRPLPCALFEHAAARISTIQRFFVFYDSGGNGPVQIDTRVVGINDEAFVAELAYQLGRALFDTECCRADGEAYLAYARRLFPNAKVYQTNVQNGLSDLQQQAHKLTQ